MALSILDSELLAINALQGNCKADNALNFTVLTAGDTAKFINSGTQILVMHAASGNASTVNMTLTGISAFDCGETITKVIPMFANDLKVQTNLSVCNMGEVMEITTDISAAETIECSQIVLAQTN